MEKHHETDPQIINFYAAVTYEMHRVHSVCITPLASSLQLDLVLTTGDGTDLRRVVARLSDVQNLSIEKGNLLEYRLWLNVVLNTMPERYYRKYVVASSEQDEDFVCSCESIQTTVVHGDEQLNLVLASGKATPSSIT